MWDVSVLSSPFSAGFEFLLLIVIVVLSLMLFASSLQKFAASSHLLHTQRLNLGTQKTLTQPFRPSPHLHPHSILLSFSNRVRTGDKDAGERACGGLLL